MRVIQGWFVLFGTWEPLLASFIILASLLISSFSIKWTTISFSDSLQYIEIVTITALLAVNLPPLCFDIESPSQIVLHKISTSQLHAIFSVIGAITRKGVLNLKNENSANYLTMDLEGVSPHLKIDYLAVPDGRLPPQHTLNTVA